MRASATSEDGDDVTIARVAYPEILWHGQGSALLKSFHAQEVRRMP